MARRARQRSKHLPKKLRHIRAALRLSQNELIRKLDLRGFTQDYISAYERGIREPPLPVLLKYARVAGVCLDTLADDEAEMPVRLPSSPRHKR